MGYSGWHLKWGTQEELEHIAKLDRQKLIQYLNASERRQDWGDINRDIVLSKARNLLMRRR